MKKNLKYLAKKKDREEKITMLACYDYPTALWAEEAGVDIILVGDSVGVKLLGYDSPEQVTMDDILHHFKAVRRAVKEAFLIADLPLGSCRNPAQALEDSSRLLDQGADAIKIELFDIGMITYLLDNYIEVCFDMIFPWAKMQLGKSQDDDSLLLADIIKIAMSLQMDGLGLFVLTMFPEAAAKAATQWLSVPVIGVGSGRYTDGQALIAAEMLGISKAQGSGYYNRRFADFENTGRTAFQNFVRQTMAGRFPSAEHTEKMSEAEIEKFLKALENVTSSTIS